MLKLFKVKILASFLCSICNTSLSSSWFFLVTLHCMLTRPACESWPSHTLWHISVFWCLPEVTILWILAQHSRHCRQSVSMFASSRASFTFVYIHNEIKFNFLKTGQSVGICMRVQVAFSYSQSNGAKQTEKSMALNLASFTRELPRSTGTRLGWPRRKSLGYPSPRSLLGIFPGGSMVLFSTHDNRFSKRSVAKFECGTI